MAPSDIFIARYVRGKLLLMVLMCALGITFFGGIALYPDNFQPTSAFTRPAGAFGAALFALMLGVNLRELFRRRAVIIIGPSGLLWRRWSEERVPWVAFQAARFATAEGENVVRLWLKPETERPPSTLGRVSRINRHLGGGDLELSTTGTNRHFLDLATAMETCAPYLFTSPTGDRQLVNDSKELEEKAHVQKGQLHG